MALEMLPLIAGVLIAAFLLFFWVRLVREAVWTAVGIVILLAVLYVVFRVGPRQVLQELRDPFGFLEQVWNVVVAWFQAFLR